MKYTNNKNNISEILVVYILNSITKSYILNIYQNKTEYTLMIKLMEGTSSAHSFNPYTHFGHSWSYFDIQNLRLAILYNNIFIGKYYFNKTIIKKKQGLKIKLTNSLQYKC